MNLWLFGFLALCAQIFIFIQMSALYTSMLWSIGTEWQPFACGVAEIGFHLAGDCIAPGMVSSALMQNGFHLDVISLLVLVSVSTAIFIVTWKFVDYQIWDITKNNERSKMFDLMHKETPSSS